MDNSDWRQHLPEELKFWDDWLLTRGGQWPDEFEFRINPSAPLQPELAGLLSGDGDVHILDVGAGPLTWLGKTLSSRTVRITAVDPLAESHDTLLERNGILPPVRTVFAHAGDLVSAFGENSFDLLVARNTLDHGFNPVRSFREPESL